MTTLKEFEEALRAANNTEALEILDRLRVRDRATRSIRPARRLSGRKMTPELAAEILRLHQTTDMTQQEIAFQLGINQGRVNEVIKRGKWLTGDPEAPEAVSRDKAKERARDGVGFTPAKPKAAKKRKPKAEATDAQAPVSSEPPPIQPPASAAAAAAPEPVAAPVPVPVPVEAPAPVDTPPDTAPEAPADMAEASAENAPEPVAAEAATPPVEPEVNEAKPAEDAAPDAKPAKKKKGKGGATQLLFDGI